MPYAGSEQAKRAAAAKRAREVHHVTTNAHPVVFAAYQRGVFSPSQAASLVAGGARAAMGHPSEGTTPLELAWANDLVRVSGPFFAAAAAFALEKKVSAEIDGKGFAYVRGAGLPGTTAADFVEMLRKGAPTSRDTPGVSFVDGRLKLAVPRAFKLRGLLAAFARALRPGMFPASLEASDFEMSFIYLTLREDSKTQDWTRDYIKYLRSIVFLIFLDDSNGSTEFKHCDGVHVSMAVTGDILAFDPTCEHRGVATGKFRRAVYVSIRVKCSREEATLAGKRFLGKPFELPDYTDCREHVAGL